MKSFAFGLASALLLSAAASAQELKIYNPYLDKSDPRIPEEVRANITEELKINYANCVMKYLGEAQFKQAGAFVDSYSVTMKCQCIAYTTQIGESQDQCKSMTTDGEINMPLTISREKLREYGLTKY